MSDEQALPTIPFNVPVEGNGATALPLQQELNSAALRLEMERIPIITQESQQGTYFHN
jgi:hypothetical protein